MTTSARPRPQRAAVLVGTGVAAIFAVLLGYGLAAGPSRFVDPGAPFPGTPTSLAQLLGTFAATIVAALCLGALVFIVTTAVPDDQSLLDPPTYRVHLFLERLTPLWALLAAAMVIIEAAARAGSPVTRLVTDPALIDAIAASETARGWCATTVFTVVLAVGSRFTVRWNGHVLLLIPALLGVVAVPVTGNAGQGPDHDVATSAALVLAVALAIVVGVQLVATWYPSQPNMRRRVLLLQFTAASAALIYWAILIPIATAGTPLWGTGYGRLSLSGALLLAVVALTNAMQLRRTASSAWLGAAPAICGVAVLAAGAAMAVQAPPRFLIHDFTVSDIYLGYSLPGPVTAASLVTTWRFDPFLGTAAVVLGIAYLIGVLRLRRRGDSWPVGRTIAWTLGCLALLVATSSGLRAYGSAMFSVHMAEHMALNMFIPVVLVLGAPVTLALRVLPTAGKGQPPGPREWVTWMVHAPITRFLSHPVVAFLLFVGSLYAVYFTPLFDMLIRYHWGHELMSVHFLLTGYLFYWGIIGVDPGPKRLPFLGRLGLLFAVMPFHAFFGIATMTMTTALGGNFYRSLGLPWVPDLSEDQHLGGAIAWGSSELPVIIVVIALVAQWARQDRREGARADRHSDDGYDDDLDAYNAMLAELARHRR